MSDVAEYEQIDGAPAARLRDQARVVLAGNTRLSAQSGLVPCVLPHQDRGMTCGCRVVTDPDGRLVAFDERTLAHMTRRRPQMVSRLDAILGAVARPDHRDDDPAPGRERFYRCDLDPRRWLRVVVDFNESPAFVVTAFVQDHKPGLPQ